MHHLMLYAFLAVFAGSLVLGFFLHKFTITTISKNKAKMVVECLENFVSTSTHNEVDKLKQQFAAIAANLKKII